MTDVALPTRSDLVRRGAWLTWATLVYNLLEGVLAAGAALAAGSVALLGCGVDSVIEVAAGVAAIWRLRMDGDVNGRGVAERRALRVIGASFLLLALYVAWAASWALWRRDAPGQSWFGIGVAVSSLLVMPWLARQKREVATKLQSGALTAEARQTEICV